MTAITANQTITSNQTKIFLLGEALQKTPHIPTMFEPADHALIIQDTDGMKDVECGGAFDDVVVVTPYNCKIMHFLQEGQMGLPR